MDRVCGGCEDVERVLGEEAGSIYRFSSRLRVEGSDEVYFTVKVSENSVSTTFFNNLPSYADEGDLSVCILYSLINSLKQSRRTSIPVINTPCRKVVFSVMLDGL